MNLFTASELNSETFVLKQETQFPYSTTSKITLTKGGDFTLAIRHPKWADDGYSISVNGEPVSLSVKKGTATYARISRSWQAGDVVEISLPMTLRYEVCPNLNDYIAFKYGPILLAAQTTARSASEASSTGLTFESLQNEYGGEGRMDHAPGSRASSKTLTSAPLLIGERSDVLNLISRDADTDRTLHFTIQSSKGRGTGKWDKLTLVPFYTIHHARYQCYWYQQTEEAFLNSDMGQADLIAAELAARTLDFVAPGEQQSEAGHDALYNSSGNGMYRDESYRDCSGNGFIQYTLSNPEQKKDSLAIMCRFTTADKGRKCNIYLDGELFVSGYEVPSSGVEADANGFYNIEFPIPVEKMYDSNGNVKSSLVFKMEPGGTALAPGLYYLRLVDKYDIHEYQFKANEWKTGDSGRVAQSNISYNSSKNTITVRASGNNNVCLTLDFANCKYNVKGENKYLIVCGTGLSLNDGASYLWWLNGVNKASQIAPTRTLATSDGKKVITWDMSTTGLDGNCQGDLWSICKGSTIFGLTATSGTAVISYIGFVSSVDDFVTGINTPSIASASTPQGIYTLSGIRLTEELPSGIMIVNGKKVVK